MQKKILFFSNQGLSVPFLGTELELVEELLEQGHYIEILKCNGKLKSCFANPTHNIQGCAICEARSEVFFQHINFPQQQIYRLKHYTQAFNFKVPWFDTLEDIFNFKYEGINLGMGIASSIITAKRNYDVNSHTMPQLIEIVTQSAINAFLNYKAHIQRLQPDEIYLFNGRFAEVHPLVEYAKQQGIAFKTYDKGRAYGTICLYENCLPHSIQQRIVDMDVYWDQADPIERVATSQHWFEAKIKGTQTNDQSYLDKMVKNQLPQNFDNTKINVAIFNSSEDEMKAIKEWQNPLFFHQNDAITDIVKQLSAYPNVHFYLRVHPNLETVNNAQTQGIKAMQYNNLTVIPANAPVDTYSLMKACDRVISFGSTTGIEATYWGIPSILYGRSFYTHMDVTYTPQSLDEVEQLITNPSLQPKARENTYKYAYFINSRGQQLKRFNWNGKNNSTYKGIPMKRLYPLTFKYFLRFLFDIRLWFTLFPLINERSIQWADFFRLKDKNVLK